MSKKQETVADIVSEMRTPKDGENGYLRCYLEEYADRIEAAWKRERVEVREIASTTILKERVPVAVGNAAAMREELERVCGWLKRMNKERLDAFAESKITPSYAVNKQAKTIIEDNEYHIRQLEAALSAPTRNCDVGTAEEQAKRYANHCDNYLREDISTCSGCPCCGEIPFGKCEFAWEQMPYESEVK